MFRRGFPFRPRFRPRIPLPGFINPMLQRILVEANQAFEVGDYSNAAERFTRLAEKAIVEKRPRAGNWLIKAGQANVLAGDKKSGLDQLFKGLAMLFDQNRQRDLGRFAWRTIELFKEHGLIGEANQISEWMLCRQNIAADKNIELESENSQPAFKKQFPSKCSSCGAPVHPNTVDWVDNGQAACSYCSCLLTEE